ncbi:hypothetical protein VTK73DRAFT_7102 [Phialemonium thermophilum]|uniref:Uncharacterized protein n=1 Tax=Phialemonium thermophilum TaxID=223376 RepID=A0ABR3XUH0_9PEZI
MDSTDDTVYTPRPNRSVSCTNSPRAKVYSLTPPSSKKPGLLFLKSNDVLGGQGVSYAVRDIYANDTAKSKDTDPVHHAGDTTSIKPTDTLTEGDFLHFAPARPFPVPQCQPSIARPCQPCLLVPQIDVIPERFTVDDGFNALWVAVRISTLLCRMGGEYDPASLAEDSVSSKPRALDRGQKDTIPFPWLLVKCQCANHGNTGQLHYGCFGGRVCVKVKKPLLIRHPHASNLICRSKKGTFISVPVCSYWFELGYSLSWLL